MDDRINILRQSPIFARQPQKVLVDAAKRVKEIESKAQEVICTTGQIGASMYMVKSGEVKIVTQDLKGNEIVLAYLGRGKYFGEMSLLTGEGRSASAVATLDSVLYELKKKDFDHLIEKYPTLALEFSRVLSERLRKVNFPEPVRRKAPELLYLVSPLPPLIQKNLAYLLARALAEESEKKAVFVDFNFEAPDILSLLNRQDESRRIKDRLKTVGVESAREFEKHLPAHQGISLLTIDRETLQHKISSRGDISVIIGLLKERFDFIILDCGSSFRKIPNLDSFLHNKSCVISDQILYYLPSAQDVKDTNIFLEKNENINNKIAIITQRLTESKERYLPKIYSLIKKEPVDRLSLDSLDSLKTRDEIPQDMRRIARRISGMSVGVAIGSGGVRSCAGIGMLEAFDRENIPIDLVAGSGVGGAVAALYAMGKSSEESTQICQQGIGVRYPYNFFPLNHLLSPKYVYKTLRKVFKDIYLEELKIPVHVAAADLITCSQVVISQGALMKAAEIGASSPILFPTLKYKNMWLVDGSVVNMVPGDIIKEKGAGISVAIDVSSKRKHRKRKTLQSNNSIIRFLSRLPLLNNYLDVPSIPKIVLRSVFIPNLYLTQKKERFFDFHLLPSVSRYPNFGTKYTQEIVEVGRRKAYEFIPEIKKKIRELKRG